MLIIFALLFFYQKTIDYTCTLRHILNIKKPPMKRNLLLFACSFMLIANFAVAQTETQSSGKYGLPSPKDYDKWSVGLFFGQTFLASDVLKDPNNDNDLFDDISFAPAFGLQVSRQVSHSVALRLSGGYATFIA